MPSYGLTNEQILSYLVENESGLFSQRLIIGLNNIYSIDYILYKLFDKKLNIGFDDKGVSILEELTKKLEYGIGGIHLSSTTIASFKDVQEINSFLSQLKEICRKEIYIKFLDSEIRLTIKPNIYFDYNIDRLGPNYRNIANYNNVKTKDLDSNIFYIDVDGLFCPRVDFSKKIDQNKNKILDRSISLSRSGRTLFPKHFGLRDDFISSNIKNPHDDIVVVDTPIKNFLKEDISIYDLIINNTNNIGIMVGNHILTCLDKNKSACSSQKVLDFISRRYNDKLITITDSINMRSFKLLYDGNGLYDHIKTDMILMTNFYGFGVHSIFKKGNEKRSQSLEKIMMLKLLNGSITFEEVYE